jgi:hypothetical protein
MRIVDLSRTSQKELKENGVKRYAPSRSAKYIKIEEAKMKRR